VQGRRGGVRRRPRHGGYGAPKRWARSPAPSACAPKGEIKKGDMAKKFSQQAYGAHFAEVAVDMDTGEIRLRRMLGVFAAGRILNMKTATSQATGAMIWGVGSALFEEAVIDPRYGAFVNHDLAEYHVPSHADIPSVEAMFLDEVDDKANPLKIKGVGELGICGAGAHHRWRMRSTTPPAACA
jgi:xanthine dehydrogenase YagR molybdenum-binding subunit